MQQYLIWWLPTLVLLGDWAVNKRDPIWAFLLIMGGPLGAAAYLAYFWESITFPFPVAATLRSLRGGPSAPRVCPRCQRTVPRLEWTEQGRVRHLMCPECRLEVELTRGLSGRS